MACCDGSFDIASAAHYWDAVIAEVWPKAADVIRTGHRTQQFYDWVEAKPDLSAAFQRTMVTVAELVGRDIADKHKLPASARRLLDVGGGHGMYSVILCQHYPNLRTIILDSPTALKTAQEMVKRHDSSDRIGLLESDLWQASWGQEYDCILLFNLLHHFDLDTNRKLLSLAAGALKPGGRLVILEQIEGKVNGAASNAFVQLIALQYYLFADGRIYSTDEIGRLLAGTGFSAYRFHSLAKAPGTMLILPTKDG